MHQLFYNIELIYTKQKLDIMINRRYFTISHWKLHIPLFQRYWNMNFISYGNLQFHYRYKINDPWMRNMPNSFVALKEKMSHFDLKSWVTACGTKIRSGILSNLRINWLDIKSQLTLIIESIWLKYSPITLNPGSNFSSASDSTFKSKWLYFYLSVVISFWL